MGVELRRKVTPGHCTTGPACLSVPAWPVQLEHSYLVRTGIVFAESRASLVPQSSIACRMQGGWHCAGRS